MSPRNIYFLVTFHSDTTWLVQDQLFPIRIQQKSIIITSANKIKLNSTSSEEIPCVNIKDRDNSSD